MPRQLYTLAYPILSETDRDLIETFRRNHDFPYKDVVSAHFTLVFGLASIPVDDYTKHVRSIASVTSEISFVSRYAMLGVDDVTDQGYVFLVPDQGYSDFSLLHDSLYTGILEQSLRLDIPFIPHITIGTLPSTAEAKALCDEWNSKAVTIQGRIDRLTVAALAGGKVSNLMEADLAKVD